jgi:murein DD-endopeptidase MepM/ murein hydrolase activator NlpD
MRRAHALVPVVFAVATAACGNGSGVARDAVRAAAADAHDIQLPTAFHVVVDRVASGATLASLLAANHVAQDEVAQAVATAASIFDLRKFRAAQPFRLAEGEDGTLERFDYEVDGDKVLRVSRSADADRRFVAEMVPIPKTTSVGVVRGTIDEGAPSLFAAMDEAGETIDLSVALAQIFSGDIDFNTDLQPGDTFQLLVEKQYRTCDNQLASCDGAVDGRVLAGYGPILAAEFDNDGHPYRAIRFTSDSGESSYYDEHGRSLHRFFLRSPLKFTPVVTSGFSRHRLHPILRTYRPHLGIDYRAPIGAPVIAIANGVVVQAGMAGGAGRLVHLRHNNGYESEYMHLSKILVHAGQHVSQGDVIGRVGMSGLATGPHLDFRIKKNGAFVNPLSVQRQLPPGDPVSASEMPAFVKVRDRVMAELQPVVANAAAVAAHRP